MCPAKEGQAMIFSKIKDYPDSKVVIEVFASRKRAALLSNYETEKMTKILYTSCLENYAVKSKAVLNKKCKLNRYFSMIEQEYVQLKFN